MLKNILWGVLFVVVVTIAVGYSYIRQFIPPSGPAPTLADIPYAPADPDDSKGHLLDLYLPQSNTPTPVVIWTGGSGWMLDSGKETTAWLAPVLNEAGFALAGVSIRSSSQTTFPGQLHDIKSAIRWLRANSEDYGIDGTRIAVMGDSSGGWTAAMAGLTGDVPELEGLVGTTGVSSAVQAAVAFYPPTRFIEMDENSFAPCSPGTGVVGMIMGKVVCHNDATSPESMLIGCPIQSCPEMALLADPTRYISEQDPPIMIFHGQSDPIVPHAQGELLYSTLSAACHDAIFISLPTAGHGHASSFLTDDSIREGTTRRLTSNDDCSVVEPENYTPDEDTIIDFLYDALKMN